MKIQLKIIIRLSLALAICQVVTETVSAQNVGIGTALPLEKLHVIGNIRSSTLAGAGSRLVLSDPNGTLINATGVTSPAWMTTGNAGTVATTNFIGTTDSIDFVSRTNNTERMRINALGQVSVNNPAPFAFTVLSSYAGGSYDAIDGAAQGTGDGVYGQNTSAGANPGWGVTGISTSSTGFGVGGINANTSGTGVFGVGNNGLGNYPTSGAGGAFNGSVIGTYSVSSNVAAGTASSGIIGRDAGGTFTMLLGGAGVTGSAANSGVGVFAYNTGTTNANFGVYSTISSTSASSIIGFGGLSAVQGQTTVASGAGVAGFGGANGDGVYGTATGNLGYGIYGYVTTGTSQIGVYGFANSGGPTRYGGFFDNDLGTTGTKTFLIDHPLDPANKFLKHFSMESPEILNMYRGNVILDPSGEAIVDLPSYFSAVNNSNCSYYLTPIGSPAQLYIKQEVENGRFVIAGGSPGMKVSWIVYAERNDPYLQQFPEERMVEIPKSADQVGKYASPNLYGQPAEMGIFYRDRQQLKATPKEIVTGKSEDLKNKRAPKDFQLKENNPE